MIHALRDVSIIEGVYAIPAIRRRIEHDYWCPAYIDHPSIGYLGAWKEDRFCGFFMIREVSHIEIEVHACLLPHAVTDSRVLGNEAKMYIFNASSVERITLPIIGNLVSVQNYARKLGFRHEGTLRDACRKNGKLFDVEIFGMTRTDFEENSHVIHRERAR